MELQIWIVVEKSKKQRSQDLCRAYSICSRSDCKDQKMCQTGKRQYQDAVYMIHHIQHFPSYRNTVIKIHLLLIMKISKTGCTDDYCCCYH